MTRLLLDPAADLPDGGTGPATLTATLLDPDPVTVQTFTVTDASTVVDVPAPTASQAWRLTVRRPRTLLNRWGITSTDPGPIVEERTVTFTGAVPVPWAALVDVDPTTLQTPPPGGEPAWQALLDELRAEIAAGGTSGGGGGVALDTDGVPYYAPSGTHTVLLDTDGVPYYAA